MQRRLGIENENAQLHITAVKSISGSAWALAITLRSGVFVVVPRYFSTLTRGENEVAF